MKISYRITLIYTGFFLAILIVINFLVSNLTNILLVNTMKKDISTQKEYIFAQLDRYNNNNNANELKTLLMSLSRERKFIFANIRYEKGTYYWNFDNISLNIPMETNLDKISVYELHEKGQTYLYLNSKLEEDDLLINVQLIKDISDFKSFYSTLNFTLTITSIFALIISIFLGKIITRSILIPVRHITATTREITAKNLDKRIPVPENDDEISDLIRIINSMIERLEISFDMQNQFISDASHELRTPLSVIQGYIEILGGWGKNNPEILEESIDSITDEVSNMKNLIERLLFIAREENNKLKTNFENIELNLIIEKLFKDSKLIDNNVHTIRILKNDKAIVFGDGKLILQLLRILLENSIKYTEDGGTISISCEVNETSVSMSIKDSGIGIPEKDIPNLFNRFYRVDESRTKKTGGTGLGLSIAKSIIELHSGDIGIKSIVNVGTEVTIKFPLLKLKALR
jgi:signal transduction histidine kinase